MSTGPTARRPISAFVWTLALGVTLLATASVHADKYPCRELHAPELQRPAPDSFAPTGGLWFGVEDPSGGGRCQWISENGDSRVAVIERFLARDDNGTIDEWVWTTSTEPLDGWLRWRLDCDGLGRICLIQTCDRPLPAVALPIVGLDELPTPTLEDVHAERRTCGPEARHSDVVLRVRLSPLPPSFWSRGAVRARYPDGRWAVTLAEPGDASGLLAPLPMPKPDEHEVDLVLVDGGGRVVARYEIEIGADMRTNPRGDPPPAGCAGRINARR